MSCPVRAHSRRQPAQSSQPNPDFAAAQALLQQGKYDEAIAQLQATAAKNPGLKGLSHELGTAYYRKGDYIKAIESFKQALAEDPDNKEAVQLLGLSYYLSGRPAEAIPLLEKVQGWYPRANVDADYILGLCYIQSKNYPQARKAFAQMFAVPADSAASYLFTARMLLRQEFDPVAEEYAQKAIALDPKLPLAHFFLGELHLYKSRIPEAISDFQQELALNPGHAPTYYKLADAYSRIQKFDDAERLLQRSIWLDATSTGPYILMGKVLQKKGRNRARGEGSATRIGHGPKQFRHPPPAGPGLSRYGTKRRRRAGAENRRAVAGKRERQALARVGRTLLSDAYDLDFLDNNFRTKPKSTSKASDRSVRRTLLR